MYSLHEKQDHKNFFSFLPIDGRRLPEDLFAVYLNDKLLKLPLLTNVSKVPWKESIYRFPAFEKGKITYNTGLLDHEFYLNYNMYFEKMDFIS